MQNASKYKCFFIYFYNNIKILGHEENNDKHIYITNKPELKESYVCVGRREASVVCVQIIIIDIYLFGNYI